MKSNPVCSRKNGLKAEVINNYSINENADPDVVKDMLAAFDHMVPKLAYRHTEGNSPAHVKSSIVGCSITVPVVDNKLLLGTWQGIYFCEFDGPRQHNVWVQV